jgi:uncharacterized protein YjbI with pentapeptide repeats
LVGTLVSGGGILVQLHFDNEATLRAERLENLRFVRERSSLDESVSRPFAGLDLSGMPLGGLKLRGADFSTANLSGADLQGTDLTGANLSSANLDGAYLFLAKLNDAIMNFPSMNGTNVPQADFTGANITDVDLTTIRFDKSITDPIFGENCWVRVDWPEGITPPAVACPP